jgi:hypothetical protein
MPSNILESANRCFYRGNAIDGRLPFAKQLFDAV